MSKSPLRRSVLCKGTAGQEGEGRCWERGGVEIIPERTAKRGGARKHVEELPTQFYLPQSQSSPAQLSPVQFSPVQFSSVQFSPV